MFLGKILDKILGELRAIYGVLSHIREILIDIKKDKTLHGYDEKCPATEELYKELNKCD